MGGKRSIKVIKEFVNKVSKDFDISKIVFFGSRAVGKSSKDSDIDLIIVSDDFKGLDFFQRGAKMYNYWDSDYPVDFLCYTQEEYKKLSKMITIVRDANKNGIVIN